MTVSSKQVVPTLTWVWVHGHTLKEDRGGSIAERAVNHAGVASDPANVSHTRKHVSRTVVKDQLQTKEGDWELWGGAVRCRWGCGAGL